MTSINSPRDGIFQGCVGYGVFHTWVFWKKKRIQKLGRVTMALNNTQILVRVWWTSFLINIWVGRVWRSSYFNPKLGRVNSRVLTLCSIPLESSMYRSLARSTWIFSVPKLLVHIAVTPFQFRSTRGSRDGCSYLSWSAAQYAAQMYKLGHESNTRASRPKIGENWHVSFCSFAVADGKASWCYTHGLIL